MNQDLSEYGMDSRSDYRVSLREMLVLVFAET